MKYEPLKRFLEGRFDAASIRMSFADIESVLGFSLPRSARRYQAWWSNTRIGHTYAAAWLDPGWKTSGLDLTSQHITFVKAEALPGVAEGSATFLHRDAEVISVPPDALNSRALRMIDEHVKAHGGDRTSACIALLDQLANDRLAAMVDWFQKASPPLPADVDVVDLIREGRDER